MRIEAIGRRRPLTLLAVSAAAVGAVAGSASASSHRTLFVSPHGHDTAACTHKHPCKTIGRAVAKAHRGDSIKVAPGIYREQVVVDKKLNIGGQSKPTVNALDLTNGFRITSGGAGSAIHNFRIENANEEGVLALHTSRVAIQNNSVTNNDRAVGENTPSDGASSERKSVVAPITISAWPMCPSASVMRWRSSAPNARR